MRRFFEDVGFKRVETATLTYHFVNVDTNAESAGWETSNGNVAYLCLHHAHKKDRRKRIPIVVQCKSTNKINHITCGSGSIVGIGGGAHFRFSNKQKGTSSRSLFLRCIILDITNASDSEEEDSKGAHNQTKEGPEDRKTGETPDRIDERKEDNSPLAIHQHTNSDDERTAGYVLRGKGGARS